MTKNFSRSLWLGSWQLNLRENISICNSVSPTSSTRRMWKLFNSSESNWLRKLKREKGLQLPSNFFACSLSFDRGEERNLGDLGECVEGEWPERFVETGLGVSFSFWTYLLNKLRNDCRIFRERALKAESSACKIVALSACSACHSLRLS